MSDAGSRVVSSPDAGSGAAAGAVAAMVILPAVVPFGMLYGALAISAGFSRFETMLASATIYAGASQYLMLEMLGQHLGSVAIVLAVLAVNFRHVLYSAALGRRLTRFTGWQKMLAFALMVDPVFAAAEQRARETRGLPVAWYFGYAMAIYTAWMTANAIGVVFGGLVSEPARFGLDFVLPLYFLGVLLGFRRSPGFARVLIASAAGALTAQVIVGAPYHILAGALLGLGVAACVAPPGTRVR